MSTRTGKGKKRKRIGRTEDREQSERFIRAAKELGLEGGGAEFEKAMKAIAKKKPKG
jgi:hypothetical protein